MFSRKKKFAVLHKLNQLDKEKVETALKKVEFASFISFKVKTTVYLKCISKHNANLTLLKSEFYFFFKQFLQILMKVK